MLFITGCVGGVVGGGALMERLNGRGPVLLASDNPYLPANRLLQVELTSSDAIREFVDRRGQPTALGVTRGLLQRPEIHLYYPEHGEVYSFKRKSGDWQTLGPEGISSADQDVLALNNVPVDQFTTEQLGTGRQGAEKAGLVEPSLEDRVLAHLEQEPDNTARASLKPFHHIRYADFKKLPNGSYVHTVAFSGETLAVLAEWYTGNPALAAKLAVPKRVSSNAPLSLGTRVKIPKSLVRNYTAFPETALK